MVNSANTLDGVANTPVRIGQHASGQDYAPAQGGPLDQFYRAAHPSGGTCRTANTATAPTNTPTAPANTPVARANTPVGPANKPINHANTRRAYGSDPESDGRTQPNRVDFPA